jgi:hypothetical protein
MLYPATVFQLMVLLCLFLNLSHLLFREELALRLDKLKRLRDFNFGYTDDQVRIYNFKQRFGEGHKWMSHIFI